MRTRLFAIFSILVFLVILGVWDATKNKLVEGDMACGTKTLTDSLILDEKYAYFEGKKVEVPKIADNLVDRSVLGANNEDKWIEVDLSEQKLRAWEGSSLYFETLISSGLPWTPTPVGEFRIWAKLRATKMEGGSGKYYYYLPNVPFVMFFENAKVPGAKGYGLHGTYWHNDFGKQHSHGCVNLPTSYAEKLYYWTGPVMPEGKSFVRSSDENPGTRIVVHE